MRLGNRSPVDPETYVSTGDGPEVFTVASYLMNGFQKSLLELRNRRVLVFSRDDIGEIHLQWPDGAVELQRVDGVWNLKSPLQEKADQSTVETLLSDLSFLQASGFVDEPSAAQRETFSEPFLQVELRGAEGRSLEMDLGAQSDGESRLARSGETILYRVEEKSVELLPRSLQAYRDQQLAQFDGEDVDTVEMVFVKDSGASTEAMTILARRTESGWEGTPEAVDSTMADGLVLVFSNLRAHEWVADSAGPEEMLALGLSPPRAILRALAQDEAGESRILGEVHLGNGDDARGVLATVPGRPHIFSLEGDVAEEIPVSLEDFRNRFMPLEEAQE